MGEHLSDWLNSGVDHNGPVPSSQVDNVNTELHNTSTNIKLLENSLRPFYRLHPDIIIEISEYLDPRACNDRYEPLLCATRICRSWRATLVSHPSRWSFISGSRPGLIPCLLDRSKHAQLDVHIISRRVPEVIRYTNPHVDRLSSLHIELGETSDFAAIRGLKAAPKLRRLTIKRLGVPFLNPPGYTPGITSPIPSLHHLRLVGFPITPELSQLENLTVVDLDAGCATLKTVLSLLSRNPLLRTVRLRGRHLPQDLNDGNAHPPGSIILNHLELLLSEMTPLIHLEALSPPYGARVLSGFGHGGSYSYREVGPSCTASYPIPTSFSNLRDLRKLYLVDRGEIYVKLEGEKGNIAYRMPRDRAFSSGNFSGVPLEGVTDATYELGPLFHHGTPTRPTTSQLMISRILCGVVRLQKLELSCGAKEVEYFLLVLHSLNVCRDLKVLVLSHCVDLYRQVHGLAELAMDRKLAGMGFDVVRIIHSNVGQLKATFKQKDVTRLGHAVGTLEYVEVELGLPRRSSLRFDPELGIDQPHIFF